MDWSDYFGAAKRLGPNPFYSVLEPYLCGPGRVVELGFGAGTGLGWWLDRGWQVLAIDADEGMCNYAQEVYGSRNGLEIVCADFIGVDWGEADVVSAVFSLFFGEREGFEKSWSRIREYVAGGAVFGGQLIGPGDDWAEGNVAFTREELEGLFLGLDVLYFDEVRRRGKTVYEAEKEWHVYHLVLGPQSRI